MWKAGCRCTMQNSCSNQESLEYAGFWVRLAAYVLDSLIVFAGLLIVRLIFAGISLAGGDAIIGTDILFHYSLKDIALYVLKVLYFIAFTYLTGTTLGKRAMNLQVVSKNPGEKLTLLNVVYRETVGRFLCSLPVNVGYIVAGLNPEKCGFHDMLCDTRVVYLKKVKVWKVQQQTKKAGIQKQENVETPENGLDKHMQTAEKCNTQNLAVEKSEKNVYNGYRLVDDVPEKEIKTKAIVNEPVSEIDTEE